MSRVANRIWSNASSSSSAASASSRSVSPNTYHPSHCTGSAGAAAAGLSRRILPPRITLQEGANVKIVVIAVVAALALADTAAAAPLYRTDHQAEQYLQHLPKWAGVPLHGPGTILLTFCFNGYYSVYETAHPGRRLPERRSQSGEGLFPSFQCQLVVNGRSFNLYLRPRAGPWLIRADRA